MGTYTTNKTLYMPTVGEQGWGILVNRNFETIDNFLKPITVSGNTYTFSGNHIGNQSGGTISATSISNSGTLTQTGIATFTGKITGNGGIGTTSLTTSSTITSTGKITGNGGIGTTSLTTSGTITSTGLITGIAGFEGNLTGNASTAGKLYVKTKISTDNSDYIVPYAIHEPQTAEKEVWKTSGEVSLTVEDGYTIYDTSFPYKINHGIYALSPSNSVTLRTEERTATVLFQNRGSYSITIKFYINGVLQKTFTSGGSVTETYTVKVGDVLSASLSASSNGGIAYIKITVTEPSYYIVEE